MWGYLVVLQHPDKYHADQVPNTSLSGHIFTGQSLSVTLQLGNVFLLLAAIALICCFTPHAEIARRYLIVVAFADLGHIYAAYCGLGDKLFWDLSQWNDVAWGNIGVSAFLHVNRWLTVAGVFGKLGPATNASKKTR